MKMKQLQSSLIISCQAPSDSPLHNSNIIAAMAKACVNQGAKGLRIDSPSHIRAVKELLPDIPVIGLWKQMGLNSSVYITPRFRDAVSVSDAGADIIAIDATQRSRPEGEMLSEIITQIKEKLGKPVMADIDTLENAITASDAGSDFIGTTLYGYTEVTQNLIPPSFEFIEKLVKIIDKPIICEGGVKTPQEVRKAIDLGCFSVVVGTAITGIDLLAQKFAKVIDS
jgi:N-acylglucosamine-6-phosphate 2-epimerase